MSFKHILLFFVLSITIGCTNLDLNSFIKDNQVKGQSDNLYNQGKTYIRLEEVKSTKGSAKTFLEHPKYLNKDTLSSALASIYFKEKALTGLSKEKNVFLESELLNLAPHITDAFTKASPSQYILVCSNYTKGKRFMKSELYTIFGLFIIKDKLNVVFSRIHYEELEDKNSDDTIILNRNETTFIDPFSIRKNPFWRLIPRPDQKFRKGHENWLIIDLKEDAFVKKEDYGKKATLTEEPEVANPGETISNSPTQVVLPRMSIKDQLLELKELESSGLITRKDYELRKALILGQKQEKSIKDKFNDLRKLKEAGFISDTDYDHKKRDLLEEHDDGEKKKNIKDILAVYLELRDEGFITDEDYDYKKKKLLKEF
ncbi:ABC-type Fe3+-hydroxamate transport system, periplasmic component [Candidatus Scalindua japonica]|uniref:ABC-type Fe3+-hydroxamate transport system, periplasmic component n=1 Tax=Candidatus Scalindua japonica TaxID=1284222 RepID=A0A286U132_9BACT|nr:SHOCT domain-containing protein [Candidatus Scalindua japonica]GAX61781.1 ABC-type Fe3+-hydroxamate transport system, periplasmic component [Candidatus Scalindua japonica]